MVLKIGIRENRVWKQILGILVYLFDTLTKYKIYLELKF